MRYQRRRAALGAVLAAGLILTSLPGVAAAHDPLVRLVACANAGGATVHPGDPVVIRQGWAAKSKGLVTEFLNATEQTITIDGQELADDESYWEAPQKLTDGPFAGYWASFWFYYDIGALDDGQVVVVTFDHYLTHRTHDGITFDGHHPAFFGPGQFFATEENPSGVLVCEITAEAE